MSGPAAALLGCATAWDDLIRGHEADVFLIQISTIFVMSIALAVGMWGMFGAQGALLPELFGANHRYRRVDGA